MEPWYKVATPRREVREGRSFNPDEFAVRLEQVVAGTAPDDYQKPDQFFARTCFTRAFRENTIPILRRLSGETQGAPPVVSLVTQMGGGKTHMLTALWHIAQGGKRSRDWRGIQDLLQEAALTSVPAIKVAVFVGNAWDPQAGRETPWIDIARQLAGDEGVKALGSEAKNAPPGTESIDRLVALANQPVLLLFDEVLNFFARHKSFAEPTHAFLHNVVRSFGGTTNRAAVLSLPKSLVEMTDWDLQWQEKIVRVVGAIAQPLLVNDETEIAEVVRRRLFEDLGSERTRKNVAKAFAEWCFERRAQLPPEWMAVDTASTSVKTREFLQATFEACYPFHPATLSVFRRKWRALSQYQQTRGTLAMLAQWISIASQESFRQARTEPLITLGSAPIYDLKFRSVVLEQLGEPKLLAAIDSDLVGEQAHARALDADTKGTLRDIHRRVGTSVLFESSGGQKDKLAHLPELRFALGEPDIDTTSVDNAALALEDKCYFIRKVGSDGFKIGHQPTMKKVVNDRRASLDEETEVKPAMRKLVEEEFRRGASIPILPFPREGGEVFDGVKLTLIIMEPGVEWTGNGVLRDNVSEWTKQRGKSPRLYPGSLIWCIKKPGRELREKVELWLAWKKVLVEITEGTLGGDFERGDLAEIRSKVLTAEEAARDEVWGGYRFAVIADNQESLGITTIDLGAGHSSSGETLCGRVISALKSAAVLNESVGAGYIDRNWPPALKESGTWPLASLRQSFLNGSLTRLLDPDTTLRMKIGDFVAKGEFGLASGQDANGKYQRVWFQEPINADEVAFEAGVYLLTKSKATALKISIIEPIEPTTPESQPEPGPEPTTAPEPGPESNTESGQVIQTKTIRLVGDVPPEVWNRLGTRILPKLRSGADLKIGVNFTVTVGSDLAQSFTSDLRTIIDDLGLIEALNFESYE